jgi:hypothetical protein
VKAANEALQNVETAQAELKSHSLKVGELLLEAKKLHPSVKDFDAFLKKVKGLQLSRAYDLMRLASGRTTDADLKKDARERQQRHRDKKKKAKTIPEPKPVKDRPEPQPVTEISVTSRNPEETAEESAERRKAEHAAAEDIPHLEDNGNQDALACFKTACDLWLSQLSTADLAEARSYFNHVVGRCAANNRRAA